LDDIAGLATTFHRPLRLYVRLYRYRYRYTRALIVLYTYLQLRSRAADYITDVIDEYFVGSV
jgi:hypothetical protein